MTTITTTYSGELRTRAIHNSSASELVTDAPVDNKGRGEAFSPTDLLAASLGSCMLTIIGIAAAEHGFNIDGARVEITKIMAPAPRRVSVIRIELFFPHNNYLEKHKKIIGHAVKTCPVALSLHPELKQEVTIHFGAG